MKKYGADHNAEYTKKEFALLLIFVQNPERHIDGEYLYEKV